MACQTAGRYSSNNSCYGIEPKEHFSPVENTGSRAEFHKIKKLIKLILFIVCFGYSKVLDNKQVICRYGMSRSATTTKLIQPLLGYCGKNRMGGVVRDGGASSWSVPFYLCDDDGYLGCVYVALKRTFSPSLDWAFTPSRRFASRSSRLICYQIQSRRLIERFPVLYSEVGNRRKQAPQRRGVSSMFPYLVRRGPRPVAADKTRQSSCHQELCGLAGTAVPKVVAESSFRQMECHNTFSLFLLLLSIYTTA